jgi:type IV pilus assembly protein PilC
MPRFSYTAIESGTRRERRGTVESATVESATILLRARGLAPKAVDVAPESHRFRLPAKPRASVDPSARSFLHLARRVSAVQLATCTRRLAMLLRARLPLVRALETLARQEGHPRLRAVLIDLGDRIRAGGSLSDGLRRHPTVFDRLYVSMVKAGEAGGVLEVVLDRIAHFQERALRLRGRLRAAMAYPLVILAVAAGIVAALLVFVVPKFEQIFAGLLKGQPLPGLTQAVLTAAGFLCDHAGLLLGVGGVVAVAAIAWAQTDRGAALLDRWLLAVPVFGEVTVKAAVARFARTCGTLLGGGVPILAALAVARETCGNRHLAAALVVVEEKARAGEGLAGPLRATGVFPELVPSMIAVGEETGDLAETLARIADGYDEEVDRAVVTMTALVEPLLIVAMALVVGTLVIALFLPIMRIVQLLG